MRLRRRFLHLLLLPIVMSVLAACGGSVDSLADGDADQLPGRLQYRDCSEQTALLIVPVTGMPPLPPGFAYTTPAGDGLLAAIHVSGSRCASVDGDGPVQDLFAFALVTPPAALRSPDIGASAIALGGYSSRAQTVATFESWGLEGLIEHAAIDFQLSELPLLRVGSVNARGATGSITTQMNAIGGDIQPGGGHTRAYFVPNGVLVASLDAIYTPQQGVLAVGTIRQDGNGPLPVSFSAVTGSHAFGYDLIVGDVQHY